MRGMIRAVLAAAVTVGVLAMAPVAMAAPQKFVVDTIEARTLFGGETRGTDASLGKTTDFSVKEGRTLFSIPDDVTRYFPEKTIYFYPDSWGESGYLCPSRSLAPIWSCYGVQGVEPAWLEKFDEDKGAPGRMRLVATVPVQAVSMPARMGERSAPVEVLLTLRDPDNEQKTLDAVLQAANWGHADAIARRFGQAYFFRNNLEPKIQVCASADYEACAPCQSCAKLPFLKALVGPTQAPAATPPQKKHRGG